jgi:hypothetical protein
MKKIHVREKGDLNVINFSAGIDGEIGRNDGRKKSKYFEKKIWHPSKDTKQKIRFLTKPQPLSKDRGLTTLTVKKYDKPSTT